MLSPDHKSERPRTFGLAALMIMVAVAAVWFGLLRKWTLVGIAFTPVLPAIVACGIVSHLCRLRGGGMTVLQRLSSFTWFVFTSFIWILVGSIAGSALLGLLTFLFVTLQWATGLYLMPLLETTLVLVLSVILHAVVLITVLCMGLRVQIREESLPSKWSPGTVSTENGTPESHEVTKE